MKILLFLPLYFISMNGISQDWAPIGSTWHYSEFFSYWSIYDEDYTKLESIGDTLIMGITCSKITKRHKVYCNSRPNTEFMYSSNDTVFFYDTSYNTFQILYDFNATQGNSWQIIVPDYLDDDTVTVFVDSTDIININGNNLKRMYVTYFFQCEGCSQYFTSYNSTIIERIGDIKYMFNFYPEFSFACDGNIIGGLRCYQDTVLDLYETGIADSCEYKHLYIGIEENDGKKLNIFPNPAQNKITIELEKEEAFEYSILNLSGKIVHPSTLLRMANSTINISGLPNGYYLIQIIQNGRKFSSPLVISR